MQNLYPLFERNRILKKELLWSLRDYSFAHMQLEYQSYGDGILDGCMPMVRGQELVMGKGFLKHGGFIYLVTEEMAVPYEPSGQLEILKLKAEEDRRSEDFISYRLSLFLDRNVEKGEDELEICRFKLRPGSQLRDRYKDFDDMATEFDTVDVTRADWGGPGGKTLPAAVTDYFARSVLEESGSRPEDISFAYLCLNQTGAVAVRVLEHYVGSRLAGMGAPRGQWDMGAGDGGRAEREGRNRRLFDGLVRILDEIRGNRRRGKDRIGDRRKILVE